MDSSKTISSGGVVNKSPPQPTGLSRSPANGVRQDTSSSVSSGMQIGAVVPNNHRLDYAPKDCLDDIRKICQDSQIRIHALGQAINRQPGVPGSLTDLMSNDLRHIAQQFVSTSVHCRMLEQKLDERAQANFQERVAINAAHGAELSSFRRKLQVSQERVSRLEQELRTIESGHGNVDKRRKVELEKKAEKINNQKRRIKEQQDQIEKLKDKYITGPRVASKASRATSRTYDDDDSSSDLELPHSATDALRYGGGSPPRLLQLPEGLYKPTLSAKDEEFLLNNLRNLDFPPDPLPMERDPRHTHGGPPPPPGPYSHFGQPMSTPGIGMPPYGGFPPPMRPYGTQMPPNLGPGAPYTGPGYPVPPQQFQFRHDGRSRREHNHSSRVSEPQPPSNALVLRRNDDSEFDPETNTWKELFMRFFNNTIGWAQTHCALIVPGAVEDATYSNSKLWDYILKVATCHRDLHAAPTHAMFMLQSPGHRAYFIARLLLQYIEQEMLNWRFWLGWDDESDAKLNELGPIMDGTSQPLEARRNARQQIRLLIEDIGKDDDYSRFREFKQGQQVSRFQDIAGPFINTTMGKDSTIGLHSIANTAMEISAKMMASRLSFTFTWNECAVKFNYQTHIAMNSDLHAVSLQQKHTRVAIIVTPGISYRDETGRGIVARGVAKAQVLIMN